MKIPEKLYQFKKEKALLVVSGSYGASFFLAEDGNIKKIDSFTIGKESVKKSGVVKLKRKNIPHHGIALKDEKGEAKDKAHADFTKELKKRLGKFNREGISSLFIFAPDFMENSIKEIIPKTLSKSFKGMFLGNFTNGHELNLVKKIHSYHTSKKVDVIDDEAIKILKKNKR